MIFETCISLLSENYLNSLYKICFDKFQPSAPKPIISRVCDSYNFFSTFYKLFLTAGANFIFYVECNPTVHVH